MADDDKKCPECPPEGAPEYMATYGDMMTLLLCFFVLLLSMAEMDAKKFEIAASSFQQALSGVMESLPTIAIHEQVILPKLGGDDQNKKMAVEAVERMRRFVQSDEDLKEAIKVEVTDKGLAIRISDPVGFGTGSDQLEPKLREVLTGMLDIIKDIDERDIRVEGHTDDVPISTPRFPSNWELSAARSLSVVKLFYEGGEDPAKLSAVGYGEFRPLVPNTSTQNKRKNRRIEIFVEYLQKEEGSL